MQEMVRLSQDMGKKRILQDAEIQRTLLALEKFQAAISKYDDITVRAVATAAVRQASNQKDFLDLVKKKAKLDLEVLTGEEEAHYDYLGVTNTLKAKNVVILDTGGASSELILVSNSKALHEVSLPVGAVNISEQYLEKDIVSARSLFSAFTAVDELYNSIAWLHDANNLPIIVLGGSNRTLGKISRRMRDVQDTPLHGYRISKQEAFDIYEEVLSKNLEDRKKMPGLSKERGDIIVGGLTPLMLLLRYLDSDRVTFSQAGIREGILFEFIQQTTGEKVVEPEPAALTVDAEDKD
jgi:exopolyphosphatase/guanosine-5'-triphosphate,3'-diphosphate pyrophosphatase